MIAIVAFPDRYWALKVTNTLKRNKIKYRVEMDADGIGEGTVKVDRVSVSKAVRILKRINLPPYSMLK